MIEGEERPMQVMANAGDVPVVALMKAERSCW
jgi:hypothetical protein